MATRGALCECSGQLPLVPDDAFDPRPCLDCGGRTRPGRWRCDPCQAKAGDRSAAMRERLEAARRDESARVHDER